MKIKTNFRSEIVEVEFLADVLTKQTKRTYLHDPECLHTIVIVFLVRACMCVRV